MKREWTFTKDIQPGAKKVNPQSGREFEKLGTIHATAGDPIQNSIDAHDGGVEPTTVVLSIYDGDNSLTPEMVSKYFGDELRRHIASSDNNAAEISQQNRLDTFTKSCNYITIEDFNTVGLEGRIDQYDSSDNSADKNRFLWFFRAQNATSEDHDRLGSWGEGKFTLESASDLGAQIAWSIRKNYQDVEQVLMGQTTLRWHYMYSPDNGFGRTDADGTTHFDRFGPFGSFGTTKLEDTGEGYSPAPITDANEIMHFRDTFKMSRKDEPGVSILIPYANQDLLDAGAMARAIIARWLFKIYDGQLVVRIRHNGIIIHELSAETIRSEISELNWDIEPLNIGSKNDINPANRSATQWIEALDLVDWSKNIPDEGRFTTNPTGAGHAASWVNCLDDEEMVSLRERFQSGENVEITSQPFVTDLKNMNCELGKFTVVMKKAGTVADSTQYFVREGMMVPFMKTYDGVVAIVSCDSTTLSTILRDSEGPAHLSFNPGAKRVGNAANRWGYGRSTIKYVVDVVKELRAAMKSSEPIEAHPFAEFIMSIPAANAAIGTTGNLGSTTTIVPPPPPPPPPSLPAIATFSSKGKLGKIKIRRRKVNGTILSTANRTIEIDVAYVNARSRNPWRKYSENDFKASDIEITKVKGATFLSSISKPCGTGPNGACTCTDKNGKKRQCAASKKRGLVLTFHIDNDDWAIDLSGFGTSRDIAVDVNPVEVIA